MVTPQSPSRVFNGVDEDIYQEAKFAHEINDKMRVPKRIKATGEYSDEDFLLSNQNGAINSWNYNDKIDMNVPDRIIVLGHDQHLETRSVPREIQLENSLLPNVPTTGFVRVQTPPRVITLNDHHFPSASESDTSIQNSVNRSDEEDDFYVDVKSSGYNIAQAKNMTVGFNPIYDTSSGSEGQLTNNEGTSSKRTLQTQIYSQQQNNNLSVASYREGTPPLGELTQHEEVQLLRRHLTKVKERVLNLEIHNERRHQREKIVYCLGLAYFVFKTLIWLNRN